MDLCGVLALRLHARTQFAACVCTPRRAFGACHGFGDHATAADRFDEHISVGSGTRYVAVERGMELVTANRKRKRHTDRCGATVGLCRTLGSRNEFVLGRRRPAGNGEGAGEHQHALGAVVEDLADALDIRKRDRH